MQNNFNQTTKYNPYRDTSNENVFYPVLSIKKATNPYSKKIKKQTNTNFPHFKVDLKIEGYKDSGTEEDDAKNFLPPIKNYPVVHMETKVNLYNG
jgi:hypothetical protein